MLRKLLKYEFRATGRTFLPMFVAVVIISVVSRVLYSDNISQALQGSSWFVDLVYGMTAFMYVAVICAMFVMALIVLIQRFQKNLMGDEGYLMFTLPVRPWQLITAKSAAALVWSAASCAVAMLAVMILGSQYGGFFEGFGRAAESFAWFCFEVGVPVPLMIFEILLIMLVSFFSGAMMIYASIALGHLWPRHKNAGAIVSFAGLCIVMQVITTALTHILDSINFFNQDYNLQLFIWLIIAYLLLFTAAYFVITNYILSHRLNLE